jgi:hypothetical protein
LWEIGEIIGDRAFCNFIMQLQILYVRARKLAEVLTLYHL